jgi:hypothetical protein
MKVLRFRNPLLHGLITGAIFAVAWFVVSFTEDTGGLIRRVGGAILVGILFGVLITWWGRRGPLPPVV